jgi:ribosome-associated protein
MEFQLRSEFIELDNILKVLQLVANGAEAKQHILAGSVKVNNQVEMRVRRKMRAGDVVEFGEHQINITKENQ